jgi:hypothetical protein
MYVPAHRLAIGSRALARRGVGAVTQPFTVNLNDPIPAAPQSWGYGVGPGAQCPSTLQLMGITDCSDPCQANSAAGCIASTPGLPQLPTLTSSFDFSQLLSSPGASSSASWMPYVLWGGGALLALAVLKGMSR